MPSKTTANRVSFFAHVVTIPTHFLPVDVQPYFNELRRLLTIVEQKQLDEGIVVYGTDAETNATIKSDHRKDIITAFRSLIADERANSSRHHMMADMLTLTSEAREELFTLTVLKRLKKHREDREDGLPPEAREDEESGLTLYPNMYIIKGYFTYAPTIFGERAPFISEPVGEFIDHHGDEEQCDEFLAGIHPIIQELTKQCKADRSVLKDNGHKEPTRVSFTRAHKVKLFQTTMRDADTFITNVNEFGREIAACYTYTVMMMSQMLSAFSLADYIREGMLLVLREQRAELSLTELRELFTKRYKFIEKNCAELNAEMDTIRLLRRDCLSIDERKDSLKIAEHLAEIPTERESFIERYTLREELSRRG